MRYNDFWLPRRHWISCKRWNYTENITPKSLKNQGRVNSFILISWRSVQWVASMLPIAQTINKEYYFNVMPLIYICHLPQKAGIMNRQLLVFAWWIKALIIQEHFVKNSTHIVPQPPYSPDLTKDYAPDIVLRANRWKHWRPYYQKKTFRIISRTGKNRGIGALYLVGITLKALNQNLLFWEV